MIPIFSEEFLGPGEFLKYDKKDSTKTDFYYKNYSVI